MFFLLFVKKKIKFTEFVCSMEIFIFVWSVANETQSNRMEKKLLKKNERQREKCMCITHSTCDTVNNMNIETIVAKAFCFNLWRIIRNL